MEGLASSADASEARSCVARTFHPLYYTHNLPPRSFVAPTPPPPSFVAHTLHSFKKSSNMIFPKIADFTPFRTLINFSILANPLVLKNWKMSFLKSGKWKVQLLPVGAENKISVLAI